MAGQSSEEKPLWELGIWLAEPVREEFYSPGAVFIRAKDDEVFRVPRFLGEGPIPEIQNVSKLIDLVSQEMVKALKCDRVYLVSLGESTDHGIHFRLLPRYREDQGILDELDSEIKATNDGLAVMARWRKQFLLKDKQKSTDSKPFDDLRKKHNEAIEEVRDALHKRALTQRDF
jgi:diadenosine tetraphosphate (Ap4A) HIT family hydrolase